MEAWAFKKLDLMVEFLDKQAGLQYTIQERILSQKSLSAKTTGRLSLTAEIEAYDKVLNFSSLGWQEKLDMIGLIILKLSQFLLKVLTEFSSSGVFKIKWYQYPKAVAILVAFILDLKKL